MGIIYLCMLLTQTPSMHENIREIIKIFLILICISFIWSRHISVLCLIFAIKLLHIGILFIYFNVRNVFKPQIVK